MLWLSDPGETLPLPVEGCSPAVAFDTILEVHRKIMDMAVADWANESPASAVEPIVGVDLMMSSVAAQPQPPGTHVKFNESPASPVSDSVATPEVIIDLTTTSEHPLLIVVIEDGATVPPDHGTTTPAPPPPPPPPLVDDVRAMQEAYAGNHDTSTTTTITEPAPAPPPPLPRTDDVYALRDVYAGDNAKADRVRYLDANLKTMKVAYTRWWVADNAELPATQPSTSTNHTATSKWTWSTTSSEMSASSCRHSGLISTIASQVRVILAGRIVNREEVMCQVMRELSDIFNMAILPEFKDSIVDAVLEQARPLATLWEVAWPCRQHAVYCISLSMLCQLCQLYS